ncbi:MULTISPECIES: hypothetical protein [Burkholderia]|uniref:hypothetical protein n=1 Tax=Burkholderia TaxID=32008 RepID=UPI001589122C|nr:hypothetical protein [Burkholderia ambifaria]
MTTINVQFSDSTESEVVAYFASPQDPEAYQHLGTIDTSDARWASFYQNAGVACSGLPEIEPAEPSAPDAA